MKLGFNYEIRFSVGNLKLFENCTDCFVSAERHSYRLKTFVNIYFLFILPQGRANRFWGNGLGWDGIGECDRFSVFRLHLSVLYHNSAVIRIAEIRNLWLQKVYLNRQLNKISDLN